MPAEFVEFSRETRDDTAQRFVRIMNKLPPGMTGSSENPMIETDEIS
jgi:hypothetical protein